ncbi:hypothetical protein [Paracoccus sp. MC1862]|uniref:hypothetical protein n=1 Tax=Paracoccus sp. MC1862 TaxID=2760307 RepID=UPI00190E45F9|nr:hypothetical protein [Paracoccus sp. MC1862]QQO46765.1 hypothetical protein JGR78_17650 [Paracoccus sp. MC1862]
MITFVATAEHQYTVRDVLETRDHPLHGRIVILSYEEFTGLPRLPVSAYIFADHERLDEDELPAVLNRIDALRRACPDCAMLNLPDRIGNRLDIMRRLHEAGINDFRMMPLRTPPESFRYPVFLRRLDDHEGPRSGLLRTPEALRAAVAALDLDDRQGDRFVVTEYIDARNELGLHEKRSYTRVGDRLFPSALDQSRDWICKGEFTDLSIVPAAEREMAFLQVNEDEPVLRAAFEATGIQYGRADYALVNGRPQIFEINTNPYVDNPETVPERGHVAAAHISSAWLDALVRLSDAMPPSAGVWREVPHGTGRIPWAPTRRRTVHMAMRGLRQLHNETKAMRWLRRFRLIP